MSYSYTSRNPAAAASPLRSMAMIRPAHQVIGWTPAQIATFNLTNARSAVSMLEDRFAGACRALGEANRVTGKKAWTRRARQSKAFGQINSARAQLRAARAHLVASEMAMLAFAAAA